MHINFSKIDANNSAFIVHSNSYGYINLHVDLNVLKRYSHILLNLTIEKITRVIKITCKFIHKKEIHNSIAKLKNDNLVSKLFL